MVDSNGLQVSLEAVRVSGRFVYASDSQPTYIIVPDLYGTLLSCNLLVFSRYDVMATNEFWRLYDVKLALRQTVVSTMWTEWEESSLDSSKEMQRIIFNEEFWERVRAIVIMITPLYRVLRMTDMEGATLGLLVHFMRAAMDEMKACNLLAPNEKRDVISKVEERWTWMRRPIHGLAALLHPAYKAPELFTDAELLADRDAFLPKALTEEEHGKFLEELIAYNDQRGGPAFASPTTWKREYLVKPLFWWDSFGYGHRSLQKVAMRLLAQDCSSGACERSWSSYSLIHTKIRNRLSTKQLERLVYCRSNMRMLAAMHKLDHAKQVNVDDFKLTGDTLQSVNKEVDVEEERIYAELYQELEEIDRRLNVPDVENRDRRTEILLVHDDGATFTVIPESKRKTPDQIVLERQWHKTKKDLDNYLKSFRDYPISNWF
ncbi:hypothetical protein L7F22_061976 [Adiantum nelumboides]|nr:hypothetical protein [Adiantum nelumboides]